MNKNLVICICGDQSLHKVWTDTVGNFDLFVTYYGETDRKYINDGRYYATGKGTKFNILADLTVEFSSVFEQYDSILVPDDDLYITAANWSHFFDLFKTYELEIAQPSIIGWQSFVHTSNNPNCLLRYTNWVEIMTPCFSKNAFQLCKQTFRENNTNWGIESLWNKLLGAPENKIAVIDDVIALHTRPCFFGDTYWRNNNSFESATAEVAELIKKHGVTLDFVEYGQVPRRKEDFDRRPSENKFLPDNCEVLKKAITDIRTRALAGNRNFL